MTQQERDLLNGLIQRVRQTALNSTDPEAQSTIQNALGSDPNALYILCQTVLVQNFALEQAQSQLAEARQQIASAQQSASNSEHPGFLEKIFGSHRDQPSAPQPQRVQSQPGYGGPVYSGFQNTQPAGYQPYPPQGTPYGYPTSGGMLGGGGGLFGGGGGFLQGALQTAAGVAIGEMAVNSIEGLFRDFGRGDEGHRDFADNDRDGFSNFDNAGNGSDSFGDRLQAADNSNDGLSADIEDRRNDDSGFFGGDRSDSDAFAGTGDSYSDDSGSFDSGFGDDNN